MTFPADHADKRGLDASESALLFLKMMFPCVQVPSVDLETANRR